MKQKKKKMKKKKKTYPRMFSNNRHTPKDGASPKMLTTTYCNKYCCYYKPQLLTILISN